MAKKQNWTVRPHTMAKHGILTAYLHQWFAKLADFGHLTYLDGFAGRGRYEGGDDGSPIVALKALIEHQHFTKWANTNFKFIFVERNAYNFTSLKLEIDQYFLDHPMPPNITVDRIQGEFATVVEDLIANDRFMLRNPFLAFVDPFGYKGIPMKTIAPLVRNRMCELLINLSTDSINRFFAQSSVARPLDELFSLPTEARIASLPDEDRAEEIVKLYMEQLKEEAHFKYTWSFGMEFPPGHIGYHLVFGTHGIEGLKAIKEQCGA